MYFHMALAFMRILVCHAQISTNWIPRFLANLRNCSEYLAQHLKVKINRLPSRELRYPTLGKGKSSTQKFLWCQKVSTSPSETPTLGILFSVFWDPRNDWMVRQVVSDSSCKMPHRGEQQESTMKNAKKHVQVVTLIFCCFCFPQCC